MLYGDCNEFEYEALLGVLILIFLENALRQQ